MTTATATRLQLTLSCGERRYIPRWLSLCCSYNSRSPAESDVNKLLLPANDLATTPALLRRATVIDDFAVHSNAATTHALLRRATAQCKLFHDKTQSYNSRFPAESDSIIIVRPSHIVRYNSRSPAESDLGTMVSVRKGMRYNSRSPAESDAYASAS